MNYEDLTDIGNLAKAIGLSEDKLADLILAKVNEGWSNQEIADFLAGEMNADVSAKGSAQNEMDALLGLGFNPSSNYNPVGGKQYEEYVEPVEEKGPGFWDTVKNGAKAVGGAIAYPFYKMYEGATDIDPLLQLGLVNSVWGDNSVLNMYNSNEQAEKSREFQAIENEKNRKAQQEYNKLMKEESTASDTALKYAAAEKAFNDILASIQDDNKKLSKTAENRIKTAYNDLSKPHKEKYSGVMESLGLLNTDDTENNAGASETEAPRYANDAEQLMTKDDVEIEKQRINAMKAGKDKKSAMEALNAKIIDQGPKVEGGLGSTYTPEEIRKAGIVSKTDAQKIAEIKAKGSNWNDLDEKFMKSKGLYWNKKTKEWVK